MKVSEQYLSAWNRHDSAALLNCFLPDGVYIDANLNDEIPASLFALRAEELFRSFPDLRVTIEEQTKNETGVIATRWSLSGALPGKVLRGVDLLCVREDKLQSVQVYFDYKTGLIFSKVPSLHLRYQPQQSEIEVSNKHLGKQTPCHKYRTSGLSLEEATAMKDHLENLMTDKVLFLQPDISLSKLAKLLNTSTNHLSQVINSQFYCNFYDFINRYRIDYVKRIIEKSSTQNKALSLAIDSGFRSTSTFYSAFKKETGLSPSEYRATLSK